MSSYPDWCNIENWEELLTPEKAEFIHKKAETCFNNILQTYTAMQSRCVLMFIIELTLVVVLMGYFIDGINGQWNITMTAALTAIVPLCIGIIALIKPIWGITSPVAGQEPKNLLRKEVMEGYPIENIIISEAMRLQGAIDKMREAKKPVSKALLVALVSLCVAPILSLASTIISANGLL